ncbi:MAG: bifunctional DNA primase/polymerase, partial [Alphaproteobacteria bacterium]|nr:bifunctional DNA primase/polymerase [Alphaproteobacteria bacterium]
MSKAHKLNPNSYWPELISIISQLYEEGASLIPLGGSSGKQPLVKFKGRSRLPFKVICEMLLKNSSLTYGIRLHNLVVVDIDELNPNVEAKMLEIFGPTKASVLTSRGKHLYYSKNANQKIKLPARINKVDLKYGNNSFVVGPYSIRPDGQKYLPEKEEFSLKKLSSIKSISAAQSEVGNKNFHILEGTRNKYLCHKAIEFVSYDDTPD